MSLGGSVPAAVSVDDEAIIDADDVIAVAGGVGVGGKSANGNPLARPSASAWADVFLAVRFNRRNA